MAYPYKEVHVLMLSWVEDDLGVLEEIQTLERVFREIYHFSTTAHVRIPSENPYAEVERKIDDLKRFWSHPDNLLIVYYGGHGSLDGWGRMLWCPYGRIKADRDLPCLEWYALQLGLERTASDVLLLLDCCESSGSLDTPITRQGGTTELIAACGYGQTAPGAGPLSFTNALTKVLINLAHRGEIFSASELHRQIVAWFVYGTNERQYSRRLLGRKGHTVGMPTYAVESHQLPAVNHPLQTTPSSGQAPLQIHLSNNNPNLSMPPLQYSSGPQGANMSMSTSRPYPMTPTSVMQQPFVMDHTYHIGPQQPLLHQQQSMQQHPAQNIQVLHNSQLPGLAQQQQEAPQAPMNVGVQQSFPLQGGSNNSYLPQNILFLPQQPQNLLVTAQEHGNKVIMLPSMSNGTPAGILQQASTFAPAGQILQNQQGQSSMGWSTRDLLDRVLKTIPSRAPLTQNRIPNPVYVRLNGKLSATSIQLKVLDHRQQQNDEPQVATMMGVTESKSPNLAKSQHVDRWIKRLPTAVVNGISYRAVQEFLTANALVPQTESAGPSEESSAAAAAAKKRKRSSTKRSSWMYEGEELTDRNGR